MSTTSKKKAGKHDGPSKNGPRLSKAEKAKLVEEVKKQLVEQETKKLREQIQKEVEEKWRADSKERVAKLVLSLESKEHEAELKRLIEAGAKGNMSPEFKRLKDKILDDMSKFAVRNEDLTNEEFGEYMRKQNIILKEQLAKDMEYERKMTPLTSEIAKYLRPPLAPAMRAFSLNYASLLMKATTSEETLQMTRDYIQQLRELRIRETDEHFKYKPDKYRARYKYAQMTADDKSTFRVPSLEEQMVLSLIDS